MVLHATRGDSTSIALVVLRLLTSTERLLLAEIRQEQKERSATAFVFELSKKKVISRTALWHGLRKLRSLGLVSYGTKESKGEPITLTALGLQLREEEEHAGIRSGAGP